MILGHPDNVTNPAMITLARESRAMTQTDLAKALGVSQAMMSKLEAGLKTPTDDVLSRLSAQLGYPPSFFYQPDGVYGPGVSEFYHRKRQAAGSRELTRLHAAVNIVRMHIARLLRSVDIADVKIQQLDMDDFRGSPAEAAKAVRAMWKLPDGPIANVITTIEDAGGIVIRLPFGTNRVDAISTWVPRMPPLFFVNANLPTDRERHTLCHELGHMLMHDAPNPNMEAEADQFAGEFLMPSRDVSPHLDGITLERLARLKPYWRVSMRSLLYRAAQLRKVSGARERQLWIQLSPYAKVEPPELNLEPEHPTLLREILDVHRDSFGYGIEELAKMLSEEPNELIKLYGLAQKPSETRPTLRVIRTEKSNTA